MLRAVDFLWICEMLVILGAISAAAVTALALIGIAVENRKERRSGKKDGRKYAGDVRDSGHGC